MNEFKYFLLATFFFVNHFSSSSTQETADAKGMMVMKSNDL